MFKKLSFSSIKTQNTINNKDNKSSKNNYTSNKNNIPDDDLDNVAVISNADPQDVTYGSRGSINAINGPKVVSGIITSSGPGLIIKKVNQYETEKESKPKISSSVLKSMFVASQIQKPNESDFYETNNRNSANSSNLSNKQNRDTSKKFLNKVKPVTIDLSENDKLEFNTENNLKEKNLNQLTDIEMKNRIENEKNLENYIENDFENLNSYSDQSDKNTESENLDDDYDIGKSSYNFIDKDLIQINSYERNNFKNELFTTKKIVPTKKKIPQLYGDTIYYQNQMNSNLPNYLQNQFINSSKANSDKLSTCTDPHRLIKKNKNDFKQYPQKMNNHIYMAHSTATESYNSNLNNLTKNEKSGCNMTFVFDPSGRLCYFWEMIVSLAFLYNFWVIIYRFAFEEISFETMAIWLTLDSLADFIYLIDIGIHFRTAFLEEGVLQTDTKKLRQHYMNSTMFYIDCLCLLPSDILYLSMGFNSILRCFRLIKIYRFLSFLDRTERHTNYPNLLRSLTLTHYILVIFHWNACVYYIIPKKGVFGQTEWFSGLKDKKCDDVLCEYLHSFYWSTLALTITGDLPKPKTKIEYAFIIIELVFGLILTSVVLGNVSNIVTNVSAARKEFQARLDSIKTFMRMRRVPDYLKIKVIKWFDYLWMTQKSSDEDKCVGFLPAKLKAELAIHVHLDTLKRVEIFQNTEAGFLCALVLRLKPILFSPGDYVCRKGEVGKEMYIVSRGKLQVVADGGKTVLATLRAGSYFGEISILNMGTAGNRRTASVQSVGYSDLFCLSKQDMWDVLKDYPAARIRLEAIASKRLEKYKKQPSNKKNKNIHSKHNFYNENNLEYLNKGKNYKEFIPNYDKLYSERLISNSPYDYLKTNKKVNLDYNLNDLYDQYNQFDPNKPQIFLHHPELNRNYKVILDQNNQLFNGYTDINSNQVHYNQCNKFIKKGINKNLIQKNDLKCKKKQMNKLKQSSNYQIENSNNFAQLNQLNSQSCQLANTNFNYSSQESINDLQNEQCDYEINLENDLNNDIKNKLNFSCQNNNQKLNYEKLETTAKDVFQNDDKNLKKENIDTNYRILLNEISFLKQKLKLLENEKINLKINNNKKLDEELSKNQNPNLNPKKTNHSSTTSTQSLDLSQFLIEADKINKKKINEPNQFIVDIDKEEQNFNKDDDEKI